MVCVALQKKIKSIANALGIKSGETCSVRRGGPSTSAMSADLQHLPVYNLRQYQIILINEGFSLSRGRLELPIPAAN